MGNTSITINAPISGGCGTIYARNISRAVFSQSGVRSMPLECYGIKAVIWRQDESEAFCSSVQVC